VTAWLYQPAPQGRVAALRTLVYAFVVFDLLVYTSWVRTRGDVPVELYQPLRIARLLHLPPPTGTLVTVVFAVLLVLAPLAATGRLPRILGWTVFAFYLEWLIIGMSYGKVDHDRFAFLVALAVLPTVGAARHGDRRTGEADGWALRVIQVAVVATYFLAALAKIRFGGLGWMTGSVLARAFIRRGSALAELIGTPPYLLIAAQIGMVAFEALSPLVFLLSGRLRYAAIGFFYSFHLMSFATITISFAPHLVAMAAFLPLERVRPIVWGHRIVTWRRPHAPDDGSPLANIRPLQAASGTFLYDGDCAFCAMCARFIERRIPTPAAVLPWQSADLDALGVTPAQCADAVQWVPARPDDPTRASAVVGAGPVAIARLLRTSTPLWRLAGGVLGLRPVVALGWPLYRWVARNRHRLPGGTVACVVPGASPESRPAQASTGRARAAAVLAGDTGAADDGAIKVPTAEARTTQANRSVVPLPLHTKQPTHGAGSPSRKL
jgi:predicted DCC family thiol-disulfide oxidoreductase YuxK